MKIKIVNEHKYEYTVKELCDCVYIGCLDPKFTGQRLHLIRIHNLIAKFEPYAWVYIYETQSATKFTKADAITHMLNRGAEFYVFNTAQELLDWKADV